MNTIDSPRRWIGSCWDRDLNTLVRSDNNSQQRQLQQNNIPACQDRLALFLSEWRWFVEGNGAGIRLFENVLDALVGKVKLRERGIKP
jgi:hypothetical protein